MQVTENISMSEPIRKLFWKYTIPTVAAVIVNGLYVMVDGVFIGRYVGAEGLTAVNLMWPLIGCIIGVGGMIGTAGAALFSIEKGKEDHLMAARYMGNSLVLLVVTAIFVYFFLNLYAHDIFLLQLSSSPSAIILASEYGDVFSKLSFFTMSAVAFPLLIRNDDHPKLATKLMVAGACLNTLGDYVLIVYYGLGMKGAAYATTGAQAFVTILGISHFFSSRANLRLGIKDLRLSWYASYKTLTLGFASFFMYVYVSFLAALYNYSFGKYGSSITVAAYALVGYYAGFYYMFAEGVTSGIQPIISFNYGAERYYNIRRVLRMAVKMILISSIIFLAAIYAFPDVLISIYNNEDAVLHQESLLGFRLHMSACYLEAFVLLVTVYFQSVDNARKATLISLVNLFIQMPFLFILPKYWGVAGIWLAFPIANIPLAVFVFFELINDLKQHTKQLKIRHKRRILHNG